MFSFVEPEAGEPGALVEQEHFLSGSKVRLKSALLAKERVKRVFWRRRVLSKWVWRKGEVPLSKIWLLDFVPIRKG